MHGISTPGVGSYTTGYGTTGPDQDKAGYDASAFWSRSGMAMAGTPDGYDTTFGGVGNGEFHTKRKIGPFLCIFIRKLGGE